MAAGSCWGHSTVHPAGAASSWVKPSCTERRGLYPPPGTMAAWPPRHSMGGGTGSPLCLQLGSHSTRAVGSASQAGARGCTRMAHHSNKEQHGHYGNSCITAPPPPDQPGRGGTTHKQNRHLPLSQPRRLLGDGLCSPQRVPAMRLPLLPAFQAALTATAVGK